MSAPLTPEEVERAVANAVASVEMEGFHIDEETKELLRKQARGEITPEEYLQIVKKEAGIRTA